jgi:hypothetical protein
MMRISTLPSRIFAMKFSSLKPFSWGLGVGAIGWWVVLAFVFGWMSPGTASREADAQTEEAVVAAMAPVCAERFLALPNAAAKKASLADTSSWNRSQLFPEEWVTLPGESWPDSELVSACSKIVLDTPIPATQPKSASVPANNG